MGFRGTIAIVVFERANLLEKLFMSLRDCIGIEKYSVIIVQQIHSALVEQVILHNSDLVDVHIRVDGSSRSTTKNIAFNRYLATEIGFNSLKSDFVIGLEDDVEISRDSLQFAEQMYLKFNCNKDFRGVNFGSQLPFRPELCRSYSKLRYGVHGQAHLLTRRSWESGNYSQVLNADAGHYDGVIEHYLKTGFMITPNNSRYIDNGEFGSHMGGREDSNYFQNLSESYVGNAIRNYCEYSELPLNHNWRIDCVKYLKRQNLKYKLKYFIWVNRQVRSVRIVVRFLRGLELE